MIKKILQYTFLLFTILILILSCKNEERVNEEEVKKSVKVNEGKLKTQKSLINFEKIEINKITEKTFKIENDGNADLKIKSIELSGKNKDNFKISITTPFTIKTEEKKDIKVIFTANNIGLQEATITIKSEKETRKIELKAVVIDIKDPNKIFIEGNTVIKDFFIGRYEITNNEYVKFLNIKKTHKDSKNNWIKLEGNEITFEDDIYKVEQGKEKFPVRYVSYYGAMEYALWVNGDIPTYDQWVYVANGGKEPQPKDWMFFGAKDKETLNEIAWTSYNSGRKPKEVGTKKANKLGVYDMAGSVFEWIKLENTEVTKNLGGSYRSSGTSVKVGYTPRLGNKSDMSVNLGFRVIYPVK